MRIDFYFNAPDRSALAARLCAKALEQRLRVLVYVPEHELASRLDRMLWTQPALSFLPHCSTDDTLASETPILLARSMPDTPCAQVLINLADDCPTGYGSYERLIEIVTTDDEDRQRARHRFRLYRTAGHDIGNTDLARGESTAS